MSAAPEPSGELPEAVWLVMGGGALKGLAHIGAWKAVQEDGVPVAGIIGTSIGAMIGAAFAGGRPVEGMEAVARSLRRRDRCRTGGAIPRP